MRPVLLARESLMKGTKVFNFEGLQRFPVLFWKLHFCVVSCFVTVIPLFCSEQALD